MTNRPTRFAELAYVKTGTALWRIVDASTGNTVGPLYTTKMELLADLPRYVMGRTVGIGFSFIAMFLGWAFAPFDTQPQAAYWVSVAISAAGLCGVVYFDCWRA